MCVFYVPMVIITIILYNKYKELQEGKGHHRSGTYNMGAAYENYKSSYSKFQIDS